MREFIYDTLNYLEEYYQRCHSENGFSVDKRWLDWKIEQLSKGVDALIAIKKNTDMLPEIRENTSHMPEMSRDIKEIKEGLAEK